MRPRTYHATVERDDLIGDQLESVAERFCHGSFLPLLSRLVKERRLSREDLDSLRAEIERLDGEGEPL